MNIAERAKEYALAKHGDQDHGSLKMLDHLTAVTDKIKFECPRYSYILYPCILDEIEAAGWLHDILEDTESTYDELRSEFGARIADIVDNVTDGYGNNRYERHLNTYFRTRKCSASIFVKMCDRWHNHSRTIEKWEKDHEESKFGRIYAKEYNYFKFALYEPGLFPTFWLELDEQYKKLKDMSYSDKVLSR